VLGAILFLPVILSTVRLSQIKVVIWPAVLLMLSALVFAIASDISPNRMLYAIHLGLLSAFFALTAVTLFSFLKNSPTVSREQLLTAVSIYLLLAFTWAELYYAMITLCPVSFKIGTNSTDLQTALLYFSLVTLSTVGYGDVVPIGGEARMLAALEAVTGVLYVAITVAILVSGYRRGSSDSA
jgi:hypothetical protein